jgi:hypothetical protein
MNFSRLVRNNIQELKNFDPKKVEQFLQDAEKLAEKHDARYYEGNRLIQRLSADYVLSRDIAELSRSWTSPWENM